MSVDHTRRPQQAAASAPRPTARKPGTGPQHSEWVDELLSAALELAPGGRAGFLDCACVDNAPLRAEVESLLAAHARAGPLDCPPTELVARLRSMMPPSQTRIRVQGDGGDVTPERWQLIRPILDRALELHGEERTAFLRHRCGDDATLRADVETLLRAEASGGLPLDAPVGVYAADLVGELADAEATRPLREHVGVVARSVAAAAGRSERDPLGLIGATVGRYRVDALLGAGGMGVVYRATDQRLGRPAALKFLPPVWSLDERAKQRFLHEARAASSLDHPNVCTIYEADEADDGTLYIAMAFYEGETLRDRIERDRLEIDEALDLAAQAAQGLAAAHARGLVHRDIKPANLLVTTDGVLKILDFGVAKAADVGLTLSEQRPGTATYMAPEQARGDAIDGRADLWSLGVVLYEMLAGERPFRGTSDQVVLSANTDAEPRPLSSRRPDAPEALEPVIRRAMARRPEDRYASGGELAAVLRAIAEGGAQPGHTAPAAVAAVLRSSTRASRRLPYRALAVSVGLAVLIIVSWLAWPRPEPQPTPLSPARIAVLPFDNLSASEEDRYFADGITEDILTSLAGVPDLLVVSSASALAETEPPRPIPEIAQDLGVDYILRGSVRRGDERVRITAQLVDARVDVHTWAATYDRRLEDIFAVQSEIAKRVAAALDAEIASGVEARIERAPTEDLVAYNLYLRGRYYWHRRTEAGLRESARLFERAVARDSGFARAWAGVADAYAVLAFYDYLPPATAYPIAKQAADRALAIDPSLAEAHASLGYIALYYDWDWVRAEAAFQRSIELNPSYSIGHQWYANHLVAMGRFDEAILEMSRAREVNPLSLIANGALGFVYLYARRFEDAVHQLELALEMDPDWDLGHLWRGQTYEEMGRTEDAIASLRRATELSGRSGITVAALAHAYATSGARESALELLAELVTADEYRPSFEIAKVHLALGDADRAIEWLERAYDQHAHSMAFLMVDPQLEPLHADPRFIRLVTRVGLDANTRWQ